MTTRIIIAVFVMILGAAIFAYIMATETALVQMDKRNNTGYCNGVVFYMTGGDGVYTDEAPVIAKYFTHVVVRGELESPGGEICYVVPVGNSSIMLIDRYADKRMMERTWGQIDREMIEKIARIVKDMGE